MTTESKKLLTKLDHGQLRPNTPLADIYYHEALEHDARIAHEQLEVFQPMAESFRHILEHVESYAANADYDDPVHEMLPRYRAQLAAAAPFLED